MKYKITHHTHYKYHEKVNLAHNKAWMLPLEASFQHCLQKKIHITPVPSVYNEDYDFLGNLFSYFAIQYPHDEMNVIATHQVEVNRHYDLSSRLIWEEAVDVLQNSLAEQDLWAKQFALESPLVPILPSIKAYTLKSFTPSRPLLEATLHLTRRIFKDFKFVAGATHIATPLSEVFKHKKGVCQDFAHLAIACLRSIGLAAYYVSGYIETIAPEGKEKLVGADASHAWFAVYSPEIGWVDFDPTNNQLVNNQYITLAYGRDYADIPPLKGVIMSSGAQSMKVAVDVLRIE
ncbi:MAG: transglutaminase family protein [Thermoflexibacter sp.]